MYGIDIALSKCISVSGVNKEDAIVSVEYDENANEQIIKGIVKRIFNFNDCDSTIQSI